MSIVPNLRPGPEVKKITSFLKKTLKKAQHAKLIVATSGGVDSSTALALAVHAIGPASVYALKLPYNLTHPELVEHTSLITKQLKIPKKNVLEVNIAPAVDKIWGSILINLSKSQTGHSKDLNQIRLGNVMARVRMIYLYDTAKTLKALVCGTENRSEHLLGYFTRFGDEASDIEPLKHLYKTQLRQLALYLKIPQSIIDQPPTAGLWLDQTDEAELGFSYDLADQVLYLSNDKKMSPKAIATKLQRSPSVALAKGGKIRYQKLVTSVFDRVHSTSYKHHLPYTI